MRAFIIRPFGAKGGIDFDRVETLLIGPALDRVGATGRTTQDVIEAGNIREDMFQLLLVADLVIADISIDNPNAYYELGIRHALREKRTFLIRAKGMQNDVPFDLRTDRYLAYDPAGLDDPDQLRAMLESLEAGLKATLDSDRQDSPVFRVLPHLREQDRTKFLPVPREFREEVESAARHRQPGKLALLGQEAKGALWESEGLRLVGREQFNGKYHEAAIVTLEDLRTLAPQDFEANLLLGTCYQRAGDLTESDLALARVVDRTEIRATDAAEAWSLIGRNLETRWRLEWRGAEEDPPPQATLRRRAFDSPFLIQSYEAYAKAFRQKLNHYYSGLNALAMLTVALELTGAFRDAWSERFDSDDDASRRKGELEEQWRTLSGAVDLAITSREQKLALAKTPDPWLQVSAADHRFLTSERPTSIANAYRVALAGQPDFVADAVRGQLTLYLELGLFADKVARVLEVLGGTPAASSPGASPAAPGAGIPRTILFTGHRIDEPGRVLPRFPADKAPLVRTAIRAALERELALGRPLVGLAGASSGGDIIFHEVCDELGIPSTPYLALPPEAYVAASVAPAGADWIRRFWAIVERHPDVPVLAATIPVPGWLQHRPNYDIWSRNSCWILNEALAAGSRNVTLLALWDGQPGDGPGGTADLVRIAQTRGAETQILDTTTLFRLAQAAGGH